MVFMTEREENSGCAYNTAPEDGFGFTGLTNVIEFANFMRLLDQPTPAPATSSTTNGRALFETVGCALCHTPSLATSSGGLPALSYKTANLFSDLALHRMGTNLADDVTQGNAAGDEFRSAPLWGAGKRIFFLHEGQARICWMPSSSTPARARKQTA